MGLRPIWPRLCREFLNICHTFWANRSIDWAYLYTDCMLGEHYASLIPGLGMGIFLQNLDEMSDIL